MSTQPNTGIQLAELFLKNKPSLEEIKAEIAVLLNLAETFKDTDAGKMYHDAADCLTAFTRLNY